MKKVYITPCQNCLLAEFREKVSDQLNNIVRQIAWIKWKKMKDVNGKDRPQWYLVADTTLDKENRLIQFAKLLCEVEGYDPSARICPHDLYYEDYENFFGKYESFRME